MTREHVEFIEPYLFVSNWHGLCVTMWERILGDTGQNVWIINMLHVGMARHGACYLLGRDCQAIVSYQGWHHAEYNRGTTIERSRLRVGVREVWSSTCIYNPPLLGLQHGRCLLSQRA